jgi:hypothetical protein
LSSLSRRCPQTRFSSPFLPCTWCPPAVSSTTLVSVRGKRDSEGTSLISRASGGSRHEVDDEADGYQSGLIWRRFTSLLRHTSPPTFLEHTLRQCHLKLSYTEPCSWYLLINTSLNNYSDIQSNMQDV